MRWLAMSTRRWLIVVALSALVMGGFAYVRRLGDLRVIYRAQAAQFARQEAWSKLSEEGARGLADGYEAAARDEDAGAKKPMFRAAADAMRKEVARSSAQAGYFAAMKTKYERASEQPWRFLPPDPPLPGTFHKPPNEPIPRPVVAWPESDEDDVDGDPEGQNAEGQKSKRSEGQKDGGQSNRR
jgi:hypothetical protein